MSYRGRPLPPIEKWPIMRSTPRHETITLSAVTATPPHDPNNPASQWHPEGAFYLNSMQPPAPKRWSGWVIAAIAGGAVLVLALAVGILAAAAPDSTPAAATASPTSAQPHPWTPEARATTPKALTVQLGETLVYTSSGLGTDDEVRYTLAAGPQINRTTYGTKPEKGQFFALTATAQVIKGGAYVYGGDFALVTKDGTVYEATMSHAVNGGLEGTDVRTGQKVTGLVVWDIPAGVQVGAKVELRAGFGSGGDQGFWQLP